MLLCILPIGLSDNEGNRFENTWNGTRSNSSTPNTNMRSSEVVEKTRGVIVIDRSHCDIDDSTSSIKSLLECIMTTVIDCDLKNKNDYIK